MRTFSGHAQSLGLLLASMVTCSNAQTAYLHDGPCGALPAAHYTVAVSNSSEVVGTSASTRKLRVTVTLPAHSSLPESEITRTPPRSPPYPVIFFLNGFLLPFFDQLKMWLATQSELHEAVDLTRVGVAGHSRGAKLAALLFTSRRDSVQAAFLIDPVDNTRETPESDSYPSAAKALKLQHRPVGICGASVIGSCNPTGSNWQHFWPAVAEGSWLMKVHGASHNTFLHASWLVDKLLDVLCKRGSTSHQDTIALTTPVMVGWMDRELGHVNSGATKPQSVDDNKSLQDQLLEWIRNQVQLNRVDFEVKATRDTS